MRLVEQLRFHAMGSQVHVVVAGGPLGLARDAERRLRELEAMWSRFVPTSDVVRVNQGAGRAVRVHADTILLYRHGLDAWRRTGGRFDPTVHAALVASGYDCSFEQIDETTDASLGPVPAPGCSAVVIDDDAQTVMVPAGTGTDFGGLGKGLAADLVVDELMAAGATGVLANVGGDVRAGGRAPDCSWTIDVEDPFDVQRSFGVLALASGGDIAVATSSVLGRRWSRGGQSQHHLIDPVTGAPMRSRIAAVTVLARRGWLADVATKVVLDGGAWPDALGDPLPAVVFHTDGTHELRNGFDRYLHAHPTAGDAASPIHRSVLAS